MASSFVQQAVNGATGGLSTIAATFGSNTQKGSTLFAAVSWGNGSSQVVNSIADTDGNTWSATPIVAVPDATNSQAFSLFAVQGGKGGGSVSTVTVTFSLTPAFRGLIIAEYWGVVDQFVGNDQTTNTGATNFITTTAKTPKKWGETIIGFFCNSDGTTIPTVGTGYTSRASTTLGGTGMLMEDKQIGTPVSTAATATITSTQNNNQNILVTLSGQDNPAVAQRIYQNNMPAIIRSNFW